MSWMDIETQFSWELTEITCGHRDFLICTSHVRRLYSTGENHECKSYLGLHLTLNYGFIGKVFQKYLYLSFVPAEVKSKAPFYSQEKAKGDHYWMPETLPPLVFGIQILLSKYSCGNLGCSMYFNSTSSVLLSQNKLCRLLFIVRCLGQDKILYTIMVGSKRSLLACISWPVSKYQAQGMNTRLSWYLLTQLCCLPVDCASSRLLKKEFLDVD